MNTGFPTPSSRANGPHPLEGDPRPAADTPIRAALQFPTIRPVVTYILLIVTILVFLAQMGTQYFLSVDLPSALGVKANTLIVRGQLWRLFTPMFLHGSILHIAFNMYALYHVGRRLERFNGHFRFAVLYGLAGFAGNVASFLMTPAASLGSSTAIFGLLGAEAVFLYCNRSLFGGVGRRALNNILMVAGINLLLGLSPGIDNWGHVGGLIGGTLFAWFAGPLLRIEGFYPTLSLVDERETRNTILAGIGVGGIFAVLAGILIILRGQ